MPVALPGAMTGMLLAGASATSAIRLQLVVMYMLLGGNDFAALVAGKLTVAVCSTPTTNSSGRCGGSPAETAQPGQAATG